MNTFSKIKEKAEQVKKEVGHKVEKKKLEIAQDKYSFLITNKDKYQKVKEPDACGTVVGIGNKVPNFYQFDSNKNKSALDNIKDYIKKLNDPANMEVYLKSIEEILETVYTKMLCTEHYIKIQHRRDSKSNTLLTDDTVCSQYSQQYVEALFPYNTPNVTANLGLFGNRIARGANVGPKTIDAEYGYNPENYMHVAGCIVNTILIGFQNMMIAYTRDTAKEDIDSEIIMGAIKIQGIVMNHFRYLLKIKEEQLRSFTNPKIRNLALIIDIENNIKLIKFLTYSLISNFIYLHVNNSDYNISSVTEFKNLVLNLCESFNNKNNIYRKKTIRNKSNTTHAIPNRIKEAKTRNKKRDDILNDLLSMNNILSFIVSRLIHYYIGINYSIKINWGDDLYSNLDKFTNVSDNNAEQKINYTESAVDINS